MTALTQKCREGGWITRVFNFCLAVKMSRKKKFGHQLLNNPMRVWWTSGIIASFHTAIPYIVRGITGTIRYYASPSAVERDFHAINGIV